MDLVDLIETRRFLGSEFLMWLWYKSECFDGLFHTKEHGSIEVWFDDKLTMEAYLAETERNDLQGGSPAHSPEARTALRQGKRPAKAKLGIVKEGREWTVTLKAESMDLSGIKIPALLSREEEEQFYERMYLTEEIEDLMRSLYMEFLTIRLHTDVWHNIMLPQMKRWIDSDELSNEKDYPSDELAQKLAIQAHPAVEEAEQSTAKKMAQRSAARRQDDDTGEASEGAGAEASS